MEFNLDESDPKKPKATEVVMEGTVCQILSIGKDKHEKPKRDETQVVFFCFFGQWCAYGCGTIENLELFTWKSSSCSKQLDLVLSKIECFRLELIFQSTYHG